MPADVRCMNSPMALDSLLVQPLGGPMISLAVVRKHDSNEFLMLVRKDGVAGTRLCFPGGKIHTGETALSAARREVEEETGVRCVGARQLDTRIHPVSGAPIAYYWMEAKTGAATNREPGKHAAVEWIEADTVLNEIGEHLTEKVRRCLETSASLNQARGSGQGDGKLQPDLFEAAS